MNLAPLGPFTPVLGQKIAVIPGGQYAGPAQLGQVRLVNLSGFSCSVSSSSEGDLPDLAPFTTMVYDAPSRGGSLSLTPVSGSAVVAAPQITGQLYVDGGTFPGTYPQTLPVTVVDIAAGATVDLTGPVTVQGDPSLPPVNVNVAVDVTAPPSNVIIAPSTATSVERSYLMNFVGSNTLVGSPQGAPVTIVQQALGLSTDDSTVQVALPLAPTPGNLFVLIYSVYGDGSTAPNPPSPWSLMAGAQPNVGGFTRPITVNDGQVIDVTMWSPPQQQFGVCLYEVAGAAVPPASDAGVSGYSGSGKTCTTAAISNKDIPELGFCSTYAADVTQQWPASWTTSAGLNLMSSDGVMMSHGFGNQLTELAFAHGPPILIASSGYTATFSMPSATTPIGQREIFFGAVLGAAPPVPSGFRLWELEILGSSTDQPYISRNDDGQVLLATDGPIAQRASFLPNGLYIPPGVSLVTTSVDSADFGAVWSLA